MGTTNVKEPAVLGQAVIHESDWNERELREPVVASWIIGGIAFFDCVFVGADVCALLVNFFCMHLEDLWS